MRRLRPEERQCPYCSRYVTEALSEKHMDHCRARAVALLPPRQPGRRPSNRRAAVPEIVPLEDDAEDLDL